MKVIESEKILEGQIVNYAILIGDGKFDKELLSALLPKFNGPYPTIFFPMTFRTRLSGLKALKGIQLYCDFYKVYSFIYMVDRDFFDSDDNPENEIQRYLSSDLGIGITEISSINKAIFIKCQYGHRQIDLYCIVSGPEIYIEEEIAKLLELTKGTIINLSGEKDIEWKKRIKRELMQALRKEGIKKIRTLIEPTSIKKLEKAFPNICAVLKKIEKDYQNIQ